MGERSMKSRLTVGSVIQDIVLAGSQRSLRSVSELMKSRDADLYCFHLNLNEHMDNLPPVLDSLGTILDGLIVGQAWQREEWFRILQKRFSALPMFNTVRLYEGCHGTAPDPYGGMKSLIKHLIEVHGYKRIAFARGPEDNWAANQRYLAYADTLKDYGIPVDPDIVTPHLFWYDGLKAMDFLTDEQHLKLKTEIHAIIGCNDSLALAVLEGLRRLGLQVPRDVAVVGFDDHAQSSFSSPPLTTVGYSMDKYAAEMLLSLLDGKKVPEQSLTPTKVIVRRSCGCQDARVTDAAVTAAERTGKQIPVSAFPPEQRRRIAAALANAYDAGADKADWVSRSMDRLVEGFALSLSGNPAKAESSFVLALENALYQTKEADGDLQAWQGVISAFRRELAPLLDSRNSLQAENLWQQSRILIESAVIRDKSFREFQSEERSRMLRDIQTALLGTFSISSMIKILTENMPKLGIPSCYMALYENSENSRMILAYKQNDRSLQEKIGTANGDVRFKTRDLLPEGMRDSGRHSFLIEPLYFEEHQLGYVVFEMGPVDGVLYDSLRGTISSALQGSLLLEQIQEHSMQLDDVVIQTLSTSEEMQVSLAEAARQAKNVSKSAQASMDVSKSGQDAITDMIAGMQSIQKQVSDIAKSISSLSERTNQIIRIVQAVEDIASQSEVLAINASIQAARAGDTGLGFAVVAREMRNLAEQSTRATANINGIISEIKKAAEVAVAVTDQGIQGAQAGMKLASHAGATISNLSSTIEESANIAIQISESSSQQVKAMSELLKAVQTIKEASSNASTSFKAAGL
jgi:methyl-accepting chemotaxis protein/DNA-binding LacI/PurR family transcriptional regulator